MNILKSIAQLAILAAGSAIAEPSDYADWTDRGVTETVVADLRGEDRGGFSNHNYGIWNNPQTASVTNDDATAIRTTRNEAPHGFSNHDYGVWQPVETSSASAMLDGKDGQWSQRGEAEIIEASAAGDIVNDANALRYFRPIPQPASKAARADQRVNEDYIQSNEQSDVNF